ncbi:MAG: PIN domain-containing protein [Candidatus Hydrothermarchaeales archaeon]
MDLVVDANILFAALIKEGGTSNLLFSDNLHLFAPEFLMDEFEKYADVIRKKTHRTDEDFQRLIEVLKRRIIFIPIEEIKPYQKEARNISPDLLDIPYFALALGIKANIWSNDKRLKKQDQIQIFNTEDLIKWDEKITNKDGKEPSR